MIANQLIHAASTGQVHASVPLQEEIEIRGNPADLTARHRDLPGPRQGEHRLDCIRFGHDATIAHHTTRRVAPIFRTGLTQDRINLPRRHGPPAVKKPTSPRRRRP